MRVDKNGIGIHQAQLLLGDVLDGLDGADLLLLLFQHGVGVLKAGGQLILGAVCYPAAVNALAGILADNGEERHPFRRDEMAELLAGCGFEKVTWQRTGFGTGVMIAWKRKPEVDELRNAK